MIERKSSINNETMPRYLQDKQESDPFANPYRSVMPPPSNFDPKYPIESELPKNNKLFNLIFQN